MTQSFAISTSHPDALRLAQSVANLISWICRDAICSSRLRKDADIGAVYLPSPFLSPGPLQLVSVANFIIHKNEAENYFFRDSKIGKAYLPLDPCWIPLSAIELMPPNLNWEDCFFSIRIFQKIPSFFIVRTNPMHEKHCQLGGSNFDDVFVSSKSEVNFDGELMKLPKYD